jgi:hypothetical protein
VSDRSPVCRTCVQGQCEGVDEAAESWCPPQDFVVLPACGDGVGGVVAADLALLRSVLERGPGQEPLWRLLQLLFDCTEPLTETLFSEMAQDDVLATLRAYLASHPGRSKVVIVRCGVPGMSYDEVVGAWVGSPAYDSDQRLLIVMDADSSGDFLGRLREDPRNPDLRLAIHGSRRVGGADADGPSFLRQMLTAPQVGRDPTRRVVMPRLVTSRAVCVNARRMTTRRRGLLRPGRGPVSILS